ncbi:MAG: antirestriction protein ArdA [Gammaproteobacteria bacterium]
MEREPRHPEGGEQRHDTPEALQEPIFEQLSDEQRIQRGIADALNEERAINDETARRIASLLHTGPDSALYALASSGAMPERLERELLESVQDLPPAQDSWIDALLDYADGRSEDRGPRGDWGDAGEFVEQSGQTEQVASAPEQDKHTHPRIYVRCLAAYVSGILHGQWIDADQDEETLRADVETMLQASPVPGAEEYAIHDHEGFTGYPLGEYENLAFVSRLAQGIAQHGQAFAAYADWIGRGDAELEHFTDHFDGIYPTREAWAEEVANEVFEWPRHLQAIPEPLRSHVTLNLNSLTLELEQYRYVAEGDGEIYVFNPDA